MGSFQSRPDTDSSPIERRTVHEKVCQPLEISVFCALLSGIPQFVVRQFLMHRCDMGTGMRQTSRGKLSEAEVSAMFTDPHWVAVFPPILTVDQAANLFKVPKATIYDWSSRGRLQRCSFRVGKYLRIRRNEFVHTFWNEGLHHGDRHTAE